jgi:hypothetical protein
VASVDQQVQVEFARPPAAASAAPRPALDDLEPCKEVERPGIGIRVGRRHVDRHDGVAELRLVDDTPRRGGIQPRHAADGDAREVVEGGHGVGQRPGGIAEVGAETDVGTDRPSAAHRGHLTIRR